MVKRSTMIIKWSWMILAGLIILWGLSGCGSSHGDQNFQSATVKEWTDEPTIEVIDLDITVHLYSDLKTLREDMPDTLPLDSRAWYVYAGDRHHIHFVKKMTARWYGMSLNML